VEKTTESWPNVHCDDKNIGLLKFEAYSVATKMLNVFSKKIIKIRPLQKDCSASELVLLGSELDSARRMESMLVSANITIGSAFQASKNSVLLCFFDIIMVNF
jgi:hypothetical protein